MKNQKPVLHLRCYKKYGSGQSVAFDENGKALNENQIIKLVHDTMECKNFLENIGFLGYVKVDVAAAKIQNSKKEWVDEGKGLEKYQQEVDTAMYGETKAKELANKRAKKMTVKTEPVNEDAPKNDTDTAKDKDTQHDQKQLPGGSQTPPAESGTPSGAEGGEDNADAELKHWRDEYEKTFSKKVYHGWDVETLKAKINEGKND